MAKYIVSYDHLYPYPIEVEEIDSEFYKDSVSITRTLFDTWDEAVEAKSKHLRITSFY